MGNPEKAKKFQDFNHDPKNAQNMGKKSGKPFFSCRLERVAAPSMIILICLSTVAIVMGSVFIGLCIAKHRRMQMFRSSMTTDSAAAARTNAYVAAQLDMIYGTVQRNRWVLWLVFIL